MLTNITYKTLDNYFKTAKTNVYEYSELSGYSVFVCKDGPGESTSYTLCLSFKQHVVWVCGGYTSTNTLVSDLLNKANKVFQESHDVSKL